MCRKSKFNKDLKIQACEDYKVGKDSFNGLAKKYGCSSYSIRMWYYTYEIHGANAFDEIKYNRSYSVDFKLEVIAEFKSASCSIIELSAKYNISKSVISRWINKYYNGVEVKPYDPKGDVYTMKSRKTTFDERLKIVKWTIENDMNYKYSADKYGIKYALIYQWVQKFVKDGAEGLKHKQRGPKLKSVIDESLLSEVEQLKLELERERALRKRAEFSLEVHKKKEEFAQKNHTLK